MSENYVYGWYSYADGSEVEFRYPIERSDDLTQSGKCVTVEIKFPGHAWEQRRAIVGSYDGGNYWVTPRK